MSAGEYQVVVIGGGASGLMAAGRAAEAGARVLLFEKMAHPARKLRITGKGRCNLTNVAPLDEFCAHFGEGRRFIRHALSRFHPEQLIDFLDDLGVETITERGGRVFPTSQDARQVVEALLRWVHAQGVLVRTSTPVVRLELSAGRTRGVWIAAGSCREGAEQLVPADAVILATGGASYPATGSTGDGYRLAREAGHTILEPHAALVPLVTAGPTAPRLQGLSLRMVTAQVWVDGRKRTEQFGEMIFTHDGLSGPIILSLSKIAGEALAEGGRVEVRIDLKPALDDARLDQRLLRDLDAKGRQKLGTILKGLLPNRLTGICREQCDLPDDLEGHQVTGQQRRRLRTWLKSFRFEILRTRPLAEGIVTAGGIARPQVDPRTMGSRVSPGLFLAGEVLDVDADTGGYNLQAAFSTGHVAGAAAAASAARRDAGAPASS
jgi:predicted Rossmann fold flavoprotein